MRKVKFANLSNVINDDTRLQQEKIKKAYAFVLLRNIIEMTPIDTGRARGNWNISDKQPNYETNENLTPRLGRYVRGDGDIYIANGLPYISRLDSGYSGQAPNGIIAPAIAKTRNDFL